MILTMLNIGTKARIQSVRGKDAVKNHLGGLGFVAGSPVSIVSENGGDLIVNVKGARIALSKQLASKIILEASPRLTEQIEAHPFAPANASPLIADC